MSSAKETQSHLGAIREMQRWSDRTPGATSPNMCIAASRFLVAKLTGLVSPPTAHLNDFLHSSQAPALPRIEHKALWGNPSHAFDATYVARFNQLVVPALLTWGGQRPGANVRFVVQRRGSPYAGDRMLAEGVPMVIGVHLRHGRAAQGVNSHYVTVLRDGASNIWVIDSWGADLGSCVRRINARAAFSLAIPMQLELAAGTAVLPGSNLTLGWFEQDGTPLPSVIPL